MSEVLFINKTQYFDLLRWAFSISVPVLSGLLGVIIGAWLTTRRELTHRRYEFIEKQLNNLYSPLLALRSEISIRNELREKIKKEADEVLKKLNSKERERRSHEFKTINDYDNRKIVKELFPTYQRMVDIFRDNLWLAEADTQAYFSELLKYVELWEHWVEGALLPDIFHSIIDKELNIQTFYQHLQQKHDELRKKLAEGKA